MSRASNARQAGKQNPKQRAGKQQGGGQQGGGQQGNKQAAKGASKQAGKRTKRRRKSNAKAAKEFWGDLGSLPAEVPRIRVSAEPAAVVASLGKAPLHGHEAAADQYLKVAYQRAVMMAGALAAAADLVEGEPD